MANHRRTHRYRMAHRRATRGPRSVLIAGFALATVSGFSVVCLTGQHGPVANAQQRVSSSSAAQRVIGHPLAGMPRNTDPANVYAADGPGNLSSVVRGDIPVIYVPNSGSDTVTEIDPATYRVVRTFVTGTNPQHVVPSYDLKTLWVTNDIGNSLTPIDPRTGLPGNNVRVTDPYNMYFTPDGKRAIVVAEAHQELTFRDPHTMKLLHTLNVPCKGVDHIDFSADGSYFLATCEFSASLIKVDTAAETVVGTLHLPTSDGMPQDVKLSPDGKVFYVADMMANGVYVVDGTTMRVEKFIATGKGAHGLYVSRDARFLYVSNRLEGSISLIDLSTEKVAKKWRLAGGGSPDMGNVSANGKVLWLSGRYNAEVYAISTTSGKLLARIPVGAGPHGLAVWPIPGRYSLGHTGIMR